MSYLAVIDLGSNSTRMVVEELQEDGNFVELRRRKLDTRLAEGMDDNDGELTDAAMTRVVDALLEFQQDYMMFDDVTVVGIATAAVREAENQAEFLDKVFRAVGVEIRVLTGDQEAYYDYLGAASALDISDAWLLDTGGASVELVGIEERMATNMMSLPFGAVNLSEKFKLNVDGVVSPDAIAKATKYVNDQYFQLPWLDDTVTLPVILLGGANRSLARLDRVQHGLAADSDFHGYEMTTAAVLTTYEKLVKMTRAEREALLGLEANRADIMISGLLPLVELIKRTGSNKVIFSSSGVREGLLQEYRMNN
ncbi:Ppx/GppA phosphatase family protein [Weissella paramesenteroides]|jgi:exopolyphosphatase/guanosine-5'-triphosphate,3'-diphosphate pyrophosphatase|uniref:Exopolyphosphatase n=1 Tax=Weissella paramesenteroides TaxID=1249 RepID=A0ABD4XJ27_WEIPA|nr:exopolyphosphatase [Weissella paramesenteroides]MDF8369124.1 exopolyphosphatase [Weissella paramesenteroides]MDF8371081.1 exopolyphosphatase [Weissella paramesenteroides]MDF8373392.1 exopolyphosphatase [Weissella paramesenteroides]WIG65722.1 exopolyphosphatase [Weissella paramesenteroides]